MKGISFEWDDNKAAINEDGFFVYFVICAGKTDLVQRIAVQRVVVNHAQNPGLVDFFLVARYTVDSAENAELLI